MVSNKQIYDSSLIGFLKKLNNNKNLFFVMALISTFISFGAYNTKKNTKIEIDFFVNFHPTKSLLDCDSSKSSFACLNESTSSIVFRYIDDIFLKTKMYERLEVIPYKSRNISRLSLFDKDIENKKKFTIKFETTKPLKLAEYKLKFKNIEDKISNEAYKDALKEIEFLETILGIDSYSARDYYQVIDQNLLSIPSENLQNDRQTLREVKRISVNISEYEIKPLVFENISLAKRNNFRIYLIYFNTLAFILYLIIIFLKSYKE